ncbi:hypothetical protein GCM10025882_15540 [Acinetobacter gyllenbergii]|uniref:Ribbon-helix-helix protein CopG domain-containing protein n=1 Tax=Acinetobacter gyllenbergii CIP 110306 = MTCC 11365 TaxID=1217657 RepID=A0A829HH46_9GAMM|nr:hypothetical protein [Acinetobacter gyllenbergii]EPF77269.1 hypothetical protein F957_02747 [Acinetobacter gyllenbergii CIP 110306 = MTCC 11365]EPH33267.1 hypothetical protein L293_0866 [Acinetobacter gyllenbergii CIP 110306 = MTCC 11365]GMA11129.1 hypothetical protein GCM10025882_15540 [Acinetobacter gyllenbergii]
MSTEKTPLYLTRATKLDEPRKSVIIYLPLSEYNEITALAKTSGRSKSSIAGERYNVGKAQEG